MPGRVPRQMVWFSWLMVVLFPAVAPRAEGGGPGGVRVSIWEDLPKSWAWQTLAGEPADRFESPALGFTRLPAKYNPRGIEVDRTSPFALRAETTLQEPAGRYRLILRGRGRGAAARRWPCRGRDEADQPELRRPRGRAGGGPARRPALAVRGDGRPGTDRRLAVGRPAARGRALGADRRQEAAARDRRAVRERRGTRGRPPAARRHAARRADRRGLVGLRGGGARPARRLRHRPPPPRGGVGGGLLEAAPRGRPPRGREERPPGPGRRREPDRPLHGRGARSRPARSLARRSTTRRSSAACRSTRSASSPTRRRSRRSSPIPAPTSEPGPSRRGWPTRAGPTAGWATGRTCWPRTPASSSRP